MARRRFRRLGAAKQAFATDSFRQDTCPGRPPSRATISESVSSSSPALNGLPILGVEETGQSRRRTRSCRSRCRSRSPRQAGSSRIPLAASSNSASSIERTSCLADVQGQRNPQPRGARRHGWRPDRHGYQNRGPATPQRATSLACCRRRSRARSASREMLATAPRGHLSMAKADQRGQALATVRLVLQDRQGPLARLPPSAAKAPLQK